MCSLLCSPRSWGLTVKAASREGPSSWAPTTEIMETEMGKRVEMGQGSPLQSSTAQDQ